MEPTRDQAYATPISYRDECIAVAVKARCAGSGDWLFLRSYTLTSAKIKVFISTETEVQNGKVYFYALEMNS